MSLKNTAKREIKRKGYQGAAILISPPDKSTYDKDEMEYGDSGSEIPLFAYVVGYPSARINDTTIFADDVRVLTFIDSNFDGVVQSGAKIKVLGKNMSVVRSTPYRINETIAYVEIQARG